MTFGPEEKGCHLLLIVPLATGNSVIFWRILPWTRYPAAGIALVHRFHRLLRFMRGLIGDLNRQSRKYTPLTAMAGRAVYFCSAEATEWPVVGRAQSIWTVL